MSEPNNDYQPTRPRQYRMVPSFEAVPPKPLAPLSDADYQRVKAARLDLMQQEIEQLQNKLERMETNQALLNRDLIDCVEELRAKVTRHEYILPRDQDLMVQANGSDRYPNQWVKSRRGWLAKFLGWGR
jgi:TolA-binding protein